MPSGSKPPAKPPAARPAAAKPVAARPAGAKPAPSKPPPKSNSLFAFFATAVLLGLVLLFTVGKGIFHSNHIMRLGGSSAVRDRLKISYPAPDFVGINRWVNTPPLSMDTLKGKVVLVNFWDYAAIDCVRALPHLEQWSKEYRNKGLVVVGIHSPQFDFEKKSDTVENAVAKFNLSYPLGFDNDLVTWKRYDNDIWPAYYLIDKDGQVVYRRFGEDGFDVMEHNIRYLLGLGEKTGKTSLDLSTSAPDTTLDTYLGYDHAAPNAVVKRGLQKETITNYQDSPFVPEETWMMVGPWRRGKQKITSEENNEIIRLHFKAKKVFLVMGSSSGSPAPLTLKLNGSDPGGESGKDAPNGVVNVDDYGLYELIDQKESRRSTLEIMVPVPGIDMYVFTFEE